MTTQVFERVYQIELPIPFPLQTTNVFFVDESPRTLIDTGIKTEDSFEALRKGFEGLRLGLGSTERILITHGHIDHYGQARRLSSLSNAPIYIHPEEYGWANSGLGFICIGAILAFNRALKLLHCVKWTHELALVYLFLCRPFTYLPFFGPPPGLLMIDNPYLHRHSKFLVG